MSSFAELDESVDFIRSFGNDLTIVQCTTAYPTPFEKLGLNVIGELKSRYPDARIGLSEHTGTIYAGLAGVALGAEVLEFHAVFDRRMFGPDASSSLTIDEIRRLAEGVRAIETALLHPIDKSSNAEYTDLKKIFEKSLALSQARSLGHRISFDDLEAKKPAGMGISASQFREVIGKTLKRDKQRYDFLTWDDLLESGPR